MAAGGFGVMGSVYLYKDHHPVRALIAAVVTLVILCAAVAKAVLAIRTELAKDEPLHELAACLHCLYALLTAGSVAGDSTSPKLRITIHVPTPDQKHYKQVLPYIGDQRHGAGFDREFPAQSGIVGKALRIKEIIALDRKADDIEAFIRELMNDYAYTEEDARKLDPAAQAWLAIPLLEPDKKGDQPPRVHGVLYVDSVVKKFFGEDRIGLAMHASVGLMTFVTERYSK